MHLHVPKAAKTEAKLAQQTIEEMMALHDAELARFGAAQGTSRPAVAGP